MSFRPGCLIVSAERCLIHLHRVCQHPWCRAASADQGRELANGPLYTYVRTHSPAVSKLALWSAGHFGDSGPSRPYGDLGNSDWPADPFCAMLRTHSWQPVARCSDARQQQTEELSPDVFTRRMGCCSMSASANAMTHQNVGLKRSVPA
jgi:hypothetical protein